MNMYIYITPIRQSP